MKRHVVRVNLITLIGVSLIFGIGLAKSGANHQESGRIVVLKSWPVAPIRVVAVKTKKKADIEIGSLFDEDDDWLDGFTVTVANNYDKTVTAMEIEMVFRREPGDIRPPLAYPLHYGPSPSSRDYVYRDPNKIIGVGKTAELSLSPENYKTLKRDFEQTGYPNSIKRVELVIREVGFEVEVCSTLGRFTYRTRPILTIPQRKFACVDRRDGLLIFWFERLPRKSKTKMPKKSPPKPTSSQRTTPVIGLEALAYNRFDMRPA